MTKKNRYLQIGDFAEICGVSVQAIRYYDKIGYLKPVYIDSQTNYRYYSREQIFLITNTRLLQSVGFSLSEITDFLKKESISDVKSLYIKKRDEINKEIEALTQSKSRIDNYLDFFSEMQNKTKNYLESDIHRIQLLEENPFTVVYIRDNIIFDYRNTMLLYNHLVQKVFDNSLRVQNNVISIFHNGYLKNYHRLTNIEFCLKLKEETDKKNSVLRQIDYPVYVCTVHKGKYPSSIPIYQEMLNWISQSDYKVCGPVMHFQLLPIASVPEPQDAVFEIRIPVDKK